MRIFNEPVVPGPDAPIGASITVARSMVLTHRQRDITIDYAGLHYSDPARNRYAYQLEGYDLDWVQVGTQRSARYTNLPTGIYTFHVRAANSDGIWNEDGASIAITVLPPWWRTWWAYVSYGLLFVAGVFAVDRFQRRRLLRKAQQEAEIREAHLKAQAAEALSREAAAMARESDAAARALQAENERKEIELEKAKQLEATNNELQRALKHLTETQDQLIHTEKMASLGQLTAGIAHEIKNPLNFVNNFAEINTELLREMLSELTRNPDSRIGDMQQIIEDLGLNSQKINEHGRRADGIIRAMLEHSRTGPGERRSIDLNRLLDEYVNLAYHGVRAREDGFTTDLKLDYDEALGEVELVPQEIGRVFVNLLDNAFYAVNEKRLSMNGQYAPEVSVSTRKQEEGVEIRIADNGVGIPDQVRDRVFEPFFTTKPAGSGTGLGLSLSYDIVVKGHGGALMVESEEGEGATFIVRIPAKYSVS